MKELLKGVIFKLELTRRPIGNQVQSRSTGSFSNMLEGQHI